MWINMEAEVIEVSTYLRNWIAEGGAAVIDGNWGLSISVKSLLSHGSTASSWLALCISTATAEASLVGISLL